MVYLGKSIERNMYFGAKVELFKRASEMRKNPTEAEKVLWKPPPLPGERGIRGGEA